MARSVDLRLLRTKAHSPSFFALTRDYAPGEQSDLVDFCIPCNPYFPTPGMFERLKGSLEGILKYYPSDADTITAELCNTLGLQPQTVAMGNGSTELITWIDHLLVRESLAIPIPTFGRWTDQPLETGKRVDMFPLQESQGFRLDVEEYVRFIRNRGSRVAVICNPNNPDGGFVARQDVVRMLDMLNDLDLVIVDESFIDFVDAEPYRSVAEEAAIRPNVIVLKSLGKNFGLHGIRFGYMVSNPALAGVVRRALPKWNLNSFAEVVVFMLKEHQEEYYHSLRLLARDRQMMYEQLSQLPGLTVFPSQGNFLMIKLPDGRDGTELRDYLISEFGVYVRECGNKLGSTSQFLRLVVRPQPDVQRLLNGLFAYLYGVETLTPPAQQQAQPQQLTHQQPRPLTAAETDAQWAAAVAEIAATRPVTVADIVAARPAGVPEPTYQRPAAHADTGAHRKPTDTGAMPQLTVSGVTAQHPLAVADTGSHRAVTVGAAAGNAGLNGGGLNGGGPSAVNTGAVNTGAFSTLGAGVRTDGGGNGAGNGGGNALAETTMTGNILGPATLGATAPQRTASVTDTDAQWPVSTAAEITAGRNLADTGAWPAVNNPAPSASTPAADPAPTSTPVRPSSNRSIEETGSWSIPPDLASARARAKADRSSRPTVAEIGSGRPTVADVNARSGYASLGVDDRFSLVPKQSRDQGPGTDWITIQRRGHS
ncbi:histidinol-phosphate transaminase [Thermopolyspora sp. NPDC052614]|uniref:histidinol-phosphate transaminase n=1 Tax=Thermopolyspora sp. NPDC052614 TaxID=3155682 RepID=UPI00341F8D43